MNITRINHSPLISAIENFVADTIDNDHPWISFENELAELIHELQDQYSEHLDYSAYNQAMIGLMLKLEATTDTYQKIDDSILADLKFKDLKYYFTKFQKAHEREVEKFKHQELSNRRKAIQYSELLLEHYSKMTVVRIDLSYKKEWRYLIDISDFRNDIRCFLDRLQDKDRHFKNLQGYIYALEQGSEKGYHAHFLLFFDGHKVQFDRYVADCTINVWRTITNHYGIGFNCNTKENRGSYKALGKDALGRVDRGDLIKKNNIIKVVEYLTNPDKTEQYLRVRCKHMQDFGHGKFKKPSRRGVDLTISRIPKSDCFNIDHFFDHKLN